MVILAEIQKMVTKAQEEIRSARQAPEEMKRKHLIQAKRRIKDALYQCPDLDKSRPNFESLLLEALDRQSLHGADPAPINVMELMKKAESMSPPPLSNHPSGTPYG
jgi:hypothetical protein